MRCSGIVRPRKRCTTQRIVVRSGLAAIRSTGRLRAIRDFRSAAAAFACWTASEEFGRAERSAARHHLSMKVFTSSFSIPPRGNRESPAGTTQSLREHLPGGWSPLPAWQGNSPANRARAGNSWPRNSSGASSRPSIKRTARFSLRAAITKSVAIPNCEASHSGPIAPSFNSRTVTTKGNARSGQFSPCLPPAQRLARNDTKVDFPLPGAPIKKILALSFRTSSSGLRRGSNIRM